MKKYLATGIIFICGMISALPLLAISPAVKSYQDYAMTLEVIRSVRIMIENFSTDDTKKKYDEIRTLFQDASEHFYGQNFTVAEQKYKKVKLDLIGLLETVAQNYLNRTKEILDSTSRQTFDVLIEYSRNSGMATYFRKPYDPLKDVKAWDPEKYHFFYDRTKITTYLQNGYKKYQSAKNKYEDPEIVLLKKKKSMTFANINFIIKQYLEVIQLCREAKENGIEIHRVKNINELGKSLMKYNITAGGIIPVYDDRIPEQYKVDANDNRSLIHAVEIKRLGKNQGSTK